jgi:hypothetical protein
MQKQSFRTQIKAMSDGEHFIWFLATTLFFPSTLLTLLIYIVLTGLHSIVFGDGASGFEGYNQRLAWRTRKACTYISMGIWIITAIPWVILIVGALIHGGSII